METPSKIKCAGCLRERQPDHHYKQLCGQCAYRFRKADAVASDTRGIRRDMRKAGII